MSEISKKIDEVIEAKLALLLKNQGFKKKAKNFYREHPDRMKMINIQASQFNNSSEWSFTINVGVYFPAIVEITGGSPVNGMPKEYNCTTRE